VPDMLEKIKSIIHTQLAIDKEAIQLDSSFVDDLGADSLDLVELIMRIEDAFYISIPEEDEVKLVTVKRAMQYIALAQE